MKKLLSLLGTLGLVGTTGSAVAACNNPVKSEITVDEIKELDEIKEIKNLTNLIIVNEKLKGIKIKEITSLTAELKSGSATDIVITVILEDKTQGSNGVLTFEIPGAITEGIQISDLDALQESIKLAEAVTQGDKDPLAFKKVTDAIAEARDVKEEAKAGGAKTKLDNIVKEFKALADVNGTNFKALQESIKLAAAVKVGDKDPVAFNKVTDAIAEARGIKEEAKADAVKTKLDNIIAEFKALADTNGKNYKLLQESIKLAEAVKVGDKDPVAFKKVTDAIAEARGVKEEAKADGAKTKLDNIVIEFKALADVNGTNFKALQESIKLAAAVKVGDKDPVAFNKVTDAIAEARGVKEEAKADGAKTKLDNIVIEFKALADVNGTNFKALQESIKLAEAVKVGDKDPIAFKKVTDAIAEARDVKEEAKAGGAKTKLDNIVIEFRALADTNGKNYKLLQESIKLAEAVKVGDKDPIAFNKVTDVIAEVRDVKEEAKAGGAKTKLDNIVKEFKALADTNGKNYKLLQESIKLAEAVKVGDKDPLAFKKVTDAITEAHGIKEEAKADAVKTKLDNIVAEFKALADTNGKNYKLLQKEIKKATEMNQGSKSDIAFGNLQKAIQNAKDVKKEINSIEALKILQEKVQEFIESDDIEIPNNK